MKGRFWELWPNSQPRAACRRLLSFGRFPTTSKHQFGEMGLFASEASSSISTAMLLYSTLSSSTSQGCEIYGKKLHYMIARGLSSSSYNICLGMENSQQISLRCKARHCTLQWCQPHHNIRQSQMSKVECKQHFMTYMIEHLLVYYFGKSIFSPQAISPEAKFCN